MTLTASSGLFIWDARYGSIPVIGGAPTFSRSSAGSWIDQTGTLQSAIVNTPRTEWAQLYGEDPSAPTTLGKRRPVLRLERAGTNVIASAITAFTSDGATVTPGFADPAGGTAAAKLTYNSGNGAAYVATPFTGDGTKGCSIRVRNFDSIHSHVLVYDVTAAVERHRFLITWSNGTPTLSAWSGAGTLYAPRQLTGGWWELSWSSNGIIAANTNRLEIFPDMDASTRAIFAYGPVAENAVTPTSLTSPSATRAVDTLSYAFPFVPQGMMIYERFVESGTDQIASGDAGRWHIGASNGATDARLICYYPSGGSGGYRILHEPGLQRIADLATKPAMGDTCELLCILYSTGSVEIIQSINGAAVTTSGASATVTLASAWADTLLWLNAIGNANQGATQTAVLKVVQYADVVGSTPADRMAELRSFALDSRQGVL